MEQSTPKGGMSPAVELGDMKRPWTTPVLRRLDVGLTSARNDDSNKPVDGATTAHSHS
jgi:hypothetical protein